MNSAKYTQMSDKQLKQHLIKHRNDFAALQAYLNRRHQRLNPIIATLNDSDFDRKIKNAIQNQMIGNK
ncbi:MAG: hypothetical protein ACFB2X_02900 [Rivularia sp. (in: cyanobacteria)]